MRYRTRLRYGTLWYRDTYFPEGVVNIYISALLLMSGRLDSKICIGVRSERSTTLPAQDGGAEQEEDDGGAGEGHDRGQAA